VYQLLALHSDDPILVEAVDVVLAQSLILLYELDARRHRRCWGRWVSREVDAVEIYVFRCFQVFYRVKV